MVDRKNPPPVLQALVLAEHVYQDAATGKKVICGTFNRIQFGLSPNSEEVEIADGVKKRSVMGDMQGGSPYAYISITDVCNGTRLVLQFVNLSKNKVLFGTELVVHSENRLATIEIVAPLPSLNIRESGTYAFELVCNGEILGSHRIIAEEITGPSS